jgi:hypothetical protein
MFGVLDPNGGFKQTPALTPIEADPTAIALDCTATACNVVVTVAFEETAALFASVVRPGGAPSLVELVALRSRASAATRLSLVDDELLYADTDGGAGFRMRRALIDWQ